jgi:hypothetical protein
MKEMRIHANAENHAMFTRGGEPEPPIDSGDTDSLLRGSLVTFLTDFFQNGGPAAAVDLRVIESVGLVFLVDSPCVKILP